MNKKTHFKHFLYIALFCDLLCLYSCKNKDPFQLSPEAMAYIKDCESNFYKDSFTIVRHQSTKYDLVADVYIPIPSIDDVLGQLNFFNYGGDIILFKGSMENIFINGIGSISLAFHVENKELIEITNVHENETYGSWAYATVSCGNSVVRDVFVTPLAYDTYENGDVSELMFVIIESSKRYLAAVFKADPKVHLMALSEKNCIYSDRDFVNIEAPIHGPGIFWHYKYE